MTTLEQYTSLKELAEKLQLSEISLRRYVKTGRLKAKKFGREYKIHPKDAEDFIKSFTSPTITSNHEKHVIAVQNLRTRVAKPIPGLNSHITQALLEMTHKHLSISDIKEIIKEHAEDCLDIITSIENEGVTDTSIALNLFLIDEAIRNLKIRRSLFESIIGNNAVIVLPLPPHLSDALLPLADPRNIFATDEHLPPHLRHSHYQRLDSINSSEYLRRIENVETIVLEAYIENNKIYVRNTVLNFIHNIDASLLGKIYFHSTPHIPPHATFVELELPKTTKEVTILRI